MPHYLISFDMHAMDHLPEQDMPEVARAAHAVIQEAIDAGVYVVAGGVEDKPAGIVHPDGSVTEGPRPDSVGGLTVVDVPTRAEALTWARKIAAACRCAQEVWEIGRDDELAEMLNSRR